MQNQLHAPQFMGARVTRREDPNLVTGKGKYTGDIQLEGMLHMAMVRSPYAHARIKSIDTSAALAMPGVIAVYTGADINPHMAKVLPVGVDLNGAGYSDAHPTDRPVLTVDKARCVGDPVALVIAESRYIAADAVEAVMVDFEPRMSGV